MKPRATTWFSERRQFPHMSTSNRTEKFLCPAKNCPFGHKKWKKMKEHWEKKPAHKPAHLDADPESVFDQMSREAMARQREKVASAHETKRDYDENTSRPHRRRSRSQEVPDEQARRRFPSRHERVRRRSPSPQERARSRTPSPHERARSRSHSPQIERARWYLVSSSPTLSATKPRGFLDMADMDEL